MPTLRRQPGGPRTARLFASNGWYVGGVDVNADGLRALEQELGWDNCMIRELDVTNRDAFRSFVLTFLEHAEVLDPPELRDDVVAWLESVP
jgi:NADP-dependent 3-hydroxy acid dehydrogenase YdfG